MANPEPQDAFYVLVCGDREWTDRQTIRERLEKLPNVAVVIHGGCRGADLIAGEEAAKLGLEVVAFPADWMQYGKAAGPIRNRVMLGLNPKLVIAFHPDITKSRGTKDCVGEAQRLGIAVEVINGKGEA